MTRSLHVLVSDADEGNFFEEYKGIASAALPRLQQSVYYVFVV